MSSLALDESQDNAPEERTSRLYLFAFCMCGMGATVAYTAILSSLVWFKAMFGPGVFLLLNIAVYVPALPIMLLQNAFDGRFNSNFGVRLAYRFRLIVCFGCLSAVQFFFAGRRPSADGFLSRSRGSSAEVELVAVTFLVGTFAGVAYGTLYQIISLMPDPRCNAAFAPSPTALAPSLAFAADAPPATSWPAADAA